jgi:hypothetical protein
MTSAMILPGHIAAGYITAFVTTTILSSTFGYSFTPAEQTLLLTAGALLGDAPDIDVIFSFLKKKSTDVSALRGHRDHVTHIPLLWLVLGLIIYGVSAIVTSGAGATNIGVSEFWKTLSLLIWLCPWSHLLCDSIFTDTGVRWLAPFTHKSYMTIENKGGKFPSGWKNLFLQYAFNPLCYLELAMVILALIVFFNR